MSQENMFLFTVMVPISVGITIVEFQIIGAKEYLDKRY